MIKSRLIYTVMLIGGILLYLFYRDYIAFVAFILVVSLPVLLYLITLFTGLAVKVSFADCERVVQKGKPASIALQIANSSVFHIATAKLYLESRHLFLEKTRQEVIILPIDASGITNVQAGLLSGFCGNVTLTLKKIKLYDMLGVTCHVKRLRKSMTFAVLPDIFEIDSPAAVAMVQDDESHSYSATKSGDDGSQVFDFHEYRDGDKMKNIHWKLSTKLDKLMVKELSLPISSAVCLMTELTAIQRHCRVEQLDAEIDVTASVSCWLTQKEIPHGIEWYNPTEGCGLRAEIAQADDLFLALEQLYETQPYEGAPMLDEFVSRTVQPQLSHIIYVTNLLSEEMLKSLAMLKERTAVTILFIHSEETLLANQLVQALAALEIKLVSISTLSVEEGLQEVTL